LPISLLYGLIITILISTFTAYYVGIEIYNNKQTAAVIAIFFSTMPYFFSRISQGQINLINGIYLLPIIILYIYKNNNRNSTFNFKNIIILSSSIAAIFYVGNIYIGIYSLFFIYMSTLRIIIYKKNYLINLVSSVTITVLVFVQILPLLISVKLLGSLYNRPLMDFSTTSFHYISSTEFLKNLFIFANKNYSYWFEAAYSIPFLVILVSIIIPILYKKKIPDFYIFTMISLFYYLILYIADPIYLLNNLLQNKFEFLNLQFPNRAFIVPMTALIICLGYFYNSKVITNYFKNKFYLFLIIPLLLAFINNEGYFIKLNKIDNHLAEVITSLENNNKYYLVSSPYFLLRPYQAQINNIKILSGISPYYDKNLLTAINIENYIFEVNDFTNVSAIGVKYILTNKVLVNENIKLVRKIDGDYIYEIVGYNKMDSDLGLLVVPNNTRLNHIINFDFIDIDHLLTTTEFSLYFKDTENCSIRSMSKTNITSKIIEVTTSFLDRRKENFNYIKCDIIIDKLNLKKTIVYYNLSKIISGVTGFLVLLKAILFLLLLSLIISLLRMTDSSTKYTIIPPLDQTPQK
jgi:hypothetical protein